MQDTDYDDFFPYGLYCYDDLQTEKWKFLQLVFLWYYDGVCQMGVFPYTFHSTVCCICGVGLFNVYFNVMSFDCNKKETLRIMRLGEDEFTLVKANP